MSLEFEVPDIFGIDAPVLGQTFTHTDAEKKAFLARYYRDIMTGSRPAPPPPPSPKKSGGGGRPPSPSSPTALAQATSVARQIPGIASTAQSTLSSLGSLAAGLGVTEADPNASADVSINGEFFDDELTWPGHRHYTYLWPYHTSPLGAQDPFTNAEFGAEMEVAVLDPHDGRTYRGKLSADDDMGFDETFMCASEQLPAMIYG